LKAQSFLISNKRMNMKKFLVALIGTSILINTNSVSFSKELTPYEVINKSFQSWEKQSFSGKRTQRITRQGSGGQSITMEAKAIVDFVDKDNVMVSLKEPKGISGIKYAVNSGKASIVFSDEKLAFTDSLISAGSLISDNIIGRLTTEPSLVSKNYSINMRPEDEVASKACYVIDMRPNDNRNAGKGYWPVPARTYWISKDSFQILKEDRYWAENSEPFYTSQYTEYRNMPYVESPNVKLRIPKEVNKVLLGNKKDKVETYLEAFSNPADVEKKIKEKPVYPKYMPDGFKFRETLVLNFYDTKLYIHKYDDGLNSVFVSYRTRPNLFLALIAGNFSLSLIQKMSDLSFHAPYNYLINDTKNYLIESFGDLYPEDLKRINESMNLQ
jgi:hypothetical protein